MRIKVTSGRNADEGNKPAQNTDLSVRQTLSLYHSLSLLRIHTVAYYSIKGMLLDFY